MPQEGVKRKLATSRITEFICSHPRLTLTLLLVVTLVAVQGSAAATDTDLTVGENDFGTTETGPSTDSDD